MRNSKQTLLPINRTLNERSEGIGFHPEGLGKSVFWERTRFQHPDVSKFPQSPFPRIVGYPVAVNPDLKTDRTSIQALIAMWQDEEKRLRSICKDPQTSSSIEHQVTERLAYVLDQLNSLANELSALQQATSAKS